MYIEQLYTNCLAEAAYYVESDGEAVIIDPIRETEAYVALAKSRGAKIKYILETHFHADFVSGHLDLAAATGAPIVYGPGAEPDYAIHSAKDHEMLSVGKLKLEVLHTPGHTPESTCYLLYDESGKPHALFSGDTLFVGDVGRPDLLDGKMSKEVLAGMMYESLTTKVVPLADDVLVYPAHGPGSACGKNIGKETMSTMGQQKRSNYALQPMSREEFIRQLTDGLSAPPRYYFADAVINRKGYAPLAEVMSKSDRAVKLAELEAAQAGGAIVLDARPAAEFEAGHVPGSLNVGIDGSYAWWVGTVIDIKSPLVIVAPVGKEEESVRRLARIGYENVIGYLEGGFDTWLRAGRPVSIIDSIEPEAFTSERAAGAKVLDVRNPGEYASGHIAGAISIPLAQLDARLSELDRDTKYLVHCAAGYRSMIASSMLEREGFTNFENVRGGFGKIRAHCEDLIETAA